MEELSAYTPLLSVYGHKLFDTFHSIDQYIERCIKLREVPVSREDLLAFIKHAMTKILNSDRSKYDDATYLVYSHKMRQGVILVFDKGRYSKRRDGVNDFYIKTVLPKGKYHNNRPGTEVIMFENNGIAGFNETITNYINGLLRRGTLTESTQNDEYYTVKVTEGLDAYYCNNVLFDLSAIVVEVD